MKKYTNTQKQLIKEITYNITNSATYIPGSGYTLQKIVNTAHALHKEPKYKGLTFNAVIEVIEAVNC